MRINGHEYNLKLAYYSKEQSHSIILYKTDLWLHNHKERNSLSMRLFSSEETRSQTKTKKEKENKFYTTIIIRFVLDTE